MKLFNCNEDVMRKHFKDKHKGKNYFKRYILIYWILYIPEILALAVSALLSLKWWQYQSFVADTFGESSIYIAILLTGLIALGIWFFTGHVSDFFYEEGTWDVFAIVLLALLAFNIFTDWQGVPALANEIHTAPTFMQSKEDSISNRINDIYYKYSWCGKHEIKHPKGHTCKHNFFPSSPSDLTSRFEKYNLNPTKDRENVELLQSQIKRLNSDYTTNKEVAETNRINFTKNGRGGSIVCFLIFTFCGFWKKRFENNVDKENIPEDEEDENKPNKKAQTPTEPDPSPPTGGLDMNELLELLNNSKQPPKNGTANGTKPNGYQLPENQAEENTKTASEAELLNNSQKNEEEPSSGVEAKLENLTKQLELFVNHKPDPHFHISHKEDGTIEWRECEVCKADFPVNLVTESSGKERKYCSYACYNEAKRVNTMKWKHEKKKGLRKPKSEAEEMREGEKFKIVRNDLHTDQQVIEWEKVKS